jgi:putative ABC transport system permease protein
VLTVASTSVTLFLMMILVSFVSISSEVGSTLRVYNRLISMGSQGFAQKVPVARVKEIGNMDGVAAVTPFIWYGGKYGEEVVPFAQFGIDADTIFKIYDELTVPADQLKAFQEDKAGCVVGRKLAEDHGWKLGDPLPLKADLYPFNLTLTIRAIYDGPSNRDRRMVMFHWAYLDDGLKRDFQGQGAGNAGIIVIKCKNADVMAGLAQKIDEAYASSDSPMKSQSEEAFNQMFNEMLRGYQLIIGGIGMAVVVSLIFVAGNAMAMALRERNTEIAVLKAIGFQKGQVLFIVLAEAMIVSGLGGILGSFGSKLLFDTVDIARYTAGFLPFFYVSLTTAMIGVTLSLLVGFFSGLIPAILAAQSSVINGLRKVV